MNKISLIMRYFRRFLAFLAGLVLLTSGLLKLVDPTGTALVVDGYWQWMHLGWMHPVSKAFGFALSFFEAFVGIGLITGVKRHFFALTTFILCAFFTLVSIALLVFNPNMDCGCFGQAVHLTHLQTFVKNIVLLAISALVCWHPGYDGRPRKYKHVSFAVVLAMVLAFGIHGLGAQMLVDMTYLAPGKYTNALAAFDENGEVADELLQSPKTLVVSVYDPAGLSAKRLTEIEMFRSQAENIGFNVVYLGLQQPDGSLYSADYKSLVTFNRFNGGVTYIDEGLVIKKWGRWGTNRIFSDEKTLNELYDEIASQTYIDDQSHRSLSLQAYILVLLAFLLLL